MKVGVIQSNYIPWRGYFDFIDSVELFIVLDDVQYSVGSWRNRNQVKTRDGLKWLTVPVMSAAGRFPIDEVLIGSTTHKPWQEKHRALLHEGLGKAPFFNDAMEIWEEGVAAGDTHISQLNLRLIKAICSYLKIDTPVVLSRDYDASGAKTERLIDLLKKTGATIYLSGSAAKGYIEEELFKENNIELEYKTYDYKPYPQLWDKFTGKVTVLDLIANVGPESRQFLKSQSKDVAII